MQFDAFVDFGVSVGAIDINWILPRNELCHYNDIEAELSIPVLSFGTYLSYTGQSFFSKQFWQSTECDELRDWDW